MSSYKDYLPVSKTVAGQIEIVTQLLESGILTIEEAMDALSGVSSVKRGDPFKEQKRQEFEEGLRGILHGLPDDK